MSLMFLMCLTYVSYILLHPTSLGPTQHTIVTSAPVGFEPTTYRCCAKKITTRPTLTLDLCSRQFNDIFPYVNHIEGNSITVIPAPLIAATNQGRRKIITISSKEKGKRKVIL